MYTLMDLSPDATIQGSRRVSFECSKIHKTAADGFFQPTCACADWSTWLNLEAEPSARGEANHTATTQNDAKAQGHSASEGARVGGEFRITLSVLASPPSPRETRYQYHMYHPPKYGCREGARGYLR